MNNLTAFPVFVTAARGMAPLLATELRLLGFSAEIDGEAGVRTRGTLLDCMRMNLELRTAQRVLIEVARFAAADAGKLYSNLIGLPWSEWLHATGKLCVTSSVDNETIRDTRFASLKTKDAICDALTRQAGRRPDSGPDRDDMVVHLHWKGDAATVFLDTSGDPLSRRGYRLHPLDAPMQETLAAACVLACNWPTTTPFVNPMCGSGTLAIEAALLARGTPPSLFRKNFGFMHLKGYQNADWQALLRAARERPARATPKIVATDIRPKAIEAAKLNAEAAGVANAIEFAVCDFRETALPAEPGVIMLNPEYGVRMGDEAKLAPVYRSIGDWFKKSCNGWLGCIFTANLKLAREVGLRSRRRHILYNGGLEGRLLEFEMYEGTRNP
jgi:putative N6-adenine-specific DNA methylase